MNSLGNWMRVAWAWLWPKLESLTQRLAMWRLLRESLDGFAAARPLLAVIAVCGVATWLLGDRSPTTWLAIGAVLIVLQMCISAPTSLPAKARRLAATLLVFLVALPVLGVGACASARYLMQLGSLPSRQDIRTLREENRTREAEVAPFVRPDFRDVVHAYADRIDATLSERDLCTAIALRAELNRQLHRERQTQAAHEEADTPVHPTAAPRSVDAVSGVDAVGPPRQGPPADGRSNRLGRVDRGARAIGTIIPPYLRQGPGPEPSRPPAEPKPPADGRIDTHPPAQTVLLTAQALAARGDTRRRVSDAGQLLLTAQPQTRCEVLALEVFATSTASIVVPMTPELVGRGYLAALVQPREPAAQDLQLRLVGVFDGVPMASEVMAATTLTRAPQDAGDVSAPAPESSPPRVEHFALRLLRWSPADSIYVLGDRQAPVATPHQGAPEGLGLGLGTRLN